LRILKYIFIILLAALLTILTQVGGIVYLISLLTYRFTDEWTANRLLKGAYRFLSFLIIYLLATFVLVPVIAKKSGRVPLPLTAANHLQPLNILTFLLNRNYVVPELKQAVFAVAAQMNSQFPGTTVNYLDANFPFGNGFPLFPHLSHNDGEKLDISFCYTNALTGKPTNESPSFIGYGVCEEPLPNEVNTPEMCSEKGYWQYSFMANIIPQGGKKDFTFDSRKTRQLVNLFVANPAVGKIFIEPHLKKRLNLSSEKIRFHGCQAVRHDDHIHVQLK
jgi:hypothetical protein